MGVETHVALMFWLNERDTISAVPIVTHCGFGRRFLNLLTLSRRAADRPWERAAEAYVRPRAAGTESSGFHS